MGKKKSSCPMCRQNIGVLSRINIKITKKKEPIKRVYRTRYRVAEEKIQRILNTYVGVDTHSAPGEELWEMAQKISREGKVYLCHNKQMKETFNKKMREFSEYDEKFLTLIKK